MEVNARLTLDTNAQLIGTSGTLNDIQSASRPKNDWLLESVVVNANDAVLITTAEPIDEPGRRIIYTNEAFTRNWLQPTGSVGQDTAPART